MIQALIDDLGRWERGDIAVDALEAAHPGEGVADLVAMHALIGLLTTEPEVGRGPSRRGLLAALPDRAPAPHDRAGRDREERRGVLLRRLLVAIFT